MNTGHYNVNIAEVLSDIWKLSVFGLKNWRFVYGIERIKATPHNRLIKGSV